MTTYFAHMAYVTYVNLFGEEPGSDEPVLRDMEAVLTAADEPYSEAEYYELDDDRARFNARF